ncbi:MAG: trigger factor family protein [Saprospiraceae bacterium]|nr:trigger factor family protein [Saprospiraceae bacterium]
MAQIIREDIDQLNAKIKVILEPSDYKQEYESEVKKIQQTAQIKGFRKGKMPKNSIEKLYGKGVLEEIVMNKAAEHFNSYLEDIPRLIGEPILNKDQSKIDVNNKDFYFYFDIGFAPDLVELKGMGADDMYVRYEIVEDIQKR